jgi:predicted DNA-binding transcriptional regulator AlpA
MKALLRFRDLKERKIASSWAQLARLIRDNGFPRGRLIGVNSRAWDEDEVDAWYKSRPEQNDRPLKGRAAQKVRDAKNRPRTATNESATRSQDDSPEAAAEPAPATSKRKRRDAAPQSVGRRR